MAKQNIVSAHYKHYLLVKIKILIGNILLNSKVGHISATFGEILMYRSQQDVQVFPLMFSMVSERFLRVESKKIWEIGGNGCESAQICSLFNPFFKTYYEKLGENRGQIGKASTCWYSLFCSIKSVFLKIWKEIKSIKVVLQVYYPSILSGKTYRLYLAIYSHRDRHTSLSRNAKGYHLSCNDSRGHDPTSIQSNPLKLSINSWS